MALWVSNHIFAKPAANKLRCVDAAEIDSRINDLPGISASVAPAPWDTFIQRGRPFTTDCPTHGQLKLSMTEVQASWMNDQPKP